MPPGPPRRTRSGTLLVVLALALYSLDLAFVVLGVWLLIAGFFVWKLGGLLLVLIGLELRPRISKRTDDPLGTIAADAAPELFRLVNEVSAEARGPRIDSIIVTDEFNAGCRCVGLRRRPELIIGLPLWASLDPQTRVALLGHEVGHLVNGDPQHGLLIQPVFTTFGTLSHVLQPGRRRRSAYGGSLLDTLSFLLGQLVFRPMSWSARRIQFWLYTVAARDHQRAEYYADAISMHLAGSEPARELTRILVRDHFAQRAIQRAALDSADPAQWRSAVAEAMDGSVEYESRSTSSCPVETRHRCTRPTRRAVTVRSCCGTHRAPTAASFCRPPVRPTSTENSVRSGPGSQGREPSTARMSVPPDRTSSCGPDSERTRTAKIVPETEAGDCVVMIQNLMGTTPMGPGYCIQFSLASDFPGYDLHAIPAPQPPSLRPTGGSCGAS